MILNRRAGRLFALCLALVLVSAAPAMAQRLNEIRIDQPGSDTDEYIEITGEPGADLTDLYVVVVGDGPGSVGQGAIEEIIDLSGGTIKANGTFLIAQPGFDDDGSGDKFGWQNPDLLVDLNLENDDNLTFFLVSDLQPDVSINTDLDPDDDCDIDVVLWTQVVDMVRVFDDPENGDCTYLYPPFTNPDDANTQVGPRTNLAGDPFAPAHVIKTALGPWQMGKDDPVVPTDYKGVVDTPRLQNGTLTFNGLAFPGNTVNFTTWAPGETGAKSIVMISCTGGPPTGIPLPGDGRLVPLNPDACTALGLSVSAVLTGTVNAEGISETFEIPFPNYQPIFSGVPIFAAVVTLGGGNFISIFGPTSFTLL